MAWNLYKKLKFKILLSQSWIFWDQQMTNKKGTHFFVEQLSSLR
jgi:hypothetical protein